MTFQLEDALVELESSCRNDLEAMKNAVIFNSEETEEEITGELILKFSTFLSISFTDTVTKTTYYNE